MYSFLSVPGPPGPYTYLWFLTYHLNTLTVYNEIVKEDLKHHRDFSIKDQWRKDTEKGVVKL